MSRRLAGILLFLPLFALRGQDAGRDRAEVDTLLNRWHAAAAAADADGVFSPLSEDAVYLGTDPSERWTKGQFMQFCAPYFAQKRGWSFTVLRRHVRFAVDGRTAWFDESLDTWMGPCFGSGVLTMDDRIWRIRQYHLAFTVPNARVRDVLELLSRPDGEE